MKPLMTTALNIQSISTLKGSFKIPEIRLFSIFNRVIIVVQILGNPPGINNYFDDIIVKDVMKNMGSNNSDAMSKSYE